MFSDNTQLIPGLFKYKVSASTEKVFVLVYSYIIVLNDITQNPLKSWINKISDIINEGDLYFGSKMRIKLSYGGSFIGYYKIYRINIMENIIVELNFNIPVLSEALPKNFSKRMTNDDLSYIIDLPELNCKTHCLELNIL